MIVLLNNIEKGCLITLGREYNTPTKITNVWNNISSFLLFFLLFFYYF